MAMSAFGTKRTSRLAAQNVRFWAKRTLVSMKLVRSRANGLAERSNLHPASRSEADNPERAYARARPIEQCL